MTGSPDVITALQFAIASEAHLNLQYRLDWRTAKNTGVLKVACKLHEFDGDAHTYLSKVTDRCEFLDGDPSYSIGEIIKPSTLTDMFKNELGLEMALLSPYEKAIQTCVRALDDGTRNLFEHLIKWHQKHVKWLEIQLSLIEGLAAGTGESEYISEKL